MTYDRPAVAVPATAEDILAEIRDSHRQVCEYDPAVDEDADLTFESTVAEWRDACDLHDWRLLGRALDELWRLDRGDDAWQSILEPARERTLRDVCDFVASGATRPHVEPLRILGATCLPAGVFLAIRSLLREAGADVGSLKPSTPLDEFTRRYPGVFLGPISRLAPNALPLVRICTPLYDLCFVGILLGLLVTLAGACFRFLPAMVTGVTLFLLVAHVGTRIASRRLPSKVEFGDLRTFRDMAMVVAVGVRRRGGGSVA